MYIYIYAGHDNVKNGMKNKNHNEDERKIQNGGGEAKQATKAGYQSRHPPGPGNPNPLKP